MTAVLDDTDTDVQQSMKLSGHGKGSFATHQRYHMERALPLLVPPAALPQLPAQTEGPVEDPEHRQTMLNPAESARVSSHGDETLGTILDPLKQLSPENLVEFSGLVSGADGTRMGGDSANLQDFSGDIADRDIALPAIEGAISELSAGSLVGDRNEVSDRNDPPDPPGRHADRVAAALPTPAATEVRDAVELALAAALERAALAGEWRTVSALAGELAARRAARSS
ncbi:MAG: hypothetical protein ABI548_11865 [Polyangiaceae bacterium]